MLVTAPNVYDMLGPMDVAIGGGKAGRRLLLSTARPAPPCGARRSASTRTIPWAPCLWINLSMFIRGLLGGIETHMAYADGVVFRAVR